jgi:glycosyltransferase involved in cell wall biosynthesis
MVSCVVLLHSGVKTFEDTLTSLTWCNDIVVLDEAENIESRQLTESYKGTYKVYPLKQNFSQKRNAAFEYVKHEWVLFVDSDEVVTPQLAEEIMKTIKHTSIEGYVVKRVDFFGGQELKHGETSAVSLLRLGKKSAGTWEGAVHETWHIVGKTGTLTHPLLHTPHQTVSEFLSDINVYSTMVANERVSKNVPVYAWQIVVYPFAKFVQNYIIRQGFRDGVAGAVMAGMMSFHSFLVKSKHYIAQHKPS